MINFLSTDKFSRFAAAGLLLSAAPLAAEESDQGRNESILPAHKHGRDSWNFAGVEQWSHATGNWGGLRTDLEDVGVTFEASLTIDWSKNFHGGLNTNGTAFRHLFDANLRLESEPLLGYEGGTLFIDFQTQEGPDSSADDVGDFQAFSNIDEADFTALYELWYEHRLFEDQLRIKVGKVDANSEFAFVEHGGEFINSSPGFSPTIFTLPTYPDPAMSFNVFVYPADWIYAGFGLYDGAAQEGVPTGTRGPKTFFGGPADLFFIGEAGVTWSLDDQGRDGRIGVGAWGHSGTFDRFDGGVEDGTQGLYLVLDQWLWKEDPAAEDDAQGIGMFLQYGRADPAVSEVEHHLGIGMAWTGLLPGRDDDVVGFMLSPVWFSDENNAGFSDEYEVAFEWFYKAQIMPFLAIKPDVQYIVNPGGTDLEDAVVGTLRVEITF